jgi:hypothetical protein
MPVRKASPRKKFYTPEEANATLPLVRRIVEDVVSLAQELRERHDRLQRLGTIPAMTADDPYAEELEQVEREFARGRERMEGYESELKELGIELKDYFMGLVDFPCWMDGREVYLCWRLGEAEITHWHEVHTGFAGRRKLRVEAPL